jgi:hypothetical protein
MTTTETKVFLGQTERMGSSKFGNPRFRLTFADGTSYPTSVDAGVAYGIENSDNIGVVEVTFCASSGGQHEPDLTV